MPTELRQPGAIWQATLVYSESVLLEPTPAQAKALAQMLLVLGALSPSDLMLEDTPITQGECLNAVAYSRISLQLIPVPYALHVKVEARLQEDAASVWVPALGLDLKAGQLLLWCPPEMARLPIAGQQIAKLLEEGGKSERDAMPRVHFAGHTAEWQLCTQLMSLS